MMALFGTLMVGLAVGHLTAKFLTPKLLNRARKRMLKKLLSQPVGKGK